MHRMIIKEEKLIENEKDYTREQISGSFEGEEFVLHRTNDSRESRLEVFINYSNAEDEDLIEMYYESNYDYV